MRLDGLDGTLEAFDDHLVVRRSKMRAAGRGGATELVVPWAMVRGARFAGGKDGRRQVCVDVVGHVAPTMAESDPYAVVLRRGQAATVGPLLEEICRRAQGADVEPEVVVSPPAPGPRADDAYVHAARSAERWARLAYRLSLFQLVVLLVGVLVPLIIFCIVLFALI